jgi:hypothetical protein
MCVVLGGEWRKGAIKQKQGEKEEEEESPCIV